MTLLEELAALVALGEKHGEWPYYEASNFLLTHHAELHKALEREHTARNDALDEAARLAWENTGHCCEDVAGKIHALKTTAIDAARREGK